MNLHLLREAGYLRLEPATKLALLSLCEQADEEGDTVRPSIAGVGLWTGAASQSETCSLINGLQALGLIEMIESGHDPLYRINVPCDCPDGEGWLK